jgi:hypothetical protein
VRWVARGSTEAFTLVGRVEGRAVDLRVELEHSDALGWTVGNIALDERVGKVIVGL